MTSVQKIAEIEAEMAKTQKNKATSFHLGMLKAKLAKLKREIIEARLGVSLSLPASFPHRISKIHVLNLPVEFSCHCLTI